MSNSHRRARVKPEPGLEAGEQRVQLGIRVKRAVYERMRSLAKSKGFLSVAEWARSVVIAASEK